MEGVECTDEFSLLVSCGLGLANMEKNNNQTLQRLEILNIDVKTRLVSSNIRLMATLHLPQNQIICINSLMMLAKKHTNTQRPRVAETHEQKDRFSNFLLLPGKPNVQLQVTLRGGPERTHIYTYINTHTNAFMHR